MSRASAGRDGSSMRLVSRWLAATARWLHIYLSMVAFATMLLFSVTGLTLNHPDWFAAGEATHEDHTGEVPVSLLGHAVVDPDGRSFDHEAVAARLRAAHGLSGHLADHGADDQECTLTWKGPGVAADAVIDRQTGHYTIAITRHGLVAMLNDLHKGRDSGSAWSILIDASAILLTLVAVTGFVLIFFLRRRRMPGLLAALVGTLVVVAALVIALA